MCFIETLVVSEIFSSRIDQEGPNWTFLAPHQNFIAAMTYDVPFLRHVTSNKTYDCLHVFVNFVPIALKIGKHIDWTHSMYLEKNALTKIT